jgi:hypothetical protein
MPSPLGNLQIVGYARRTVNQADCDNDSNYKKRQTPFDACLWKIPALISAPGLVL